MKKIKEEFVMNDYLLSIKEAVSEESQAVSLYETILENSKLPSTVRPVIEEILDDEKDHLVILTELLNEAVRDALPDYGDEDVAGMMTIEDESDDKR